MDRSVVEAKANGTTGVNSYKPVAVITVKFRQTIESTTACGHDTATDEGKQSVYRLV